LVYPLLIKTNEVKKRTIELNMFYGATSRLFIKAKELRENMTHAEKIVWEHIRNNKLGVRFKAQHPIERFIADFYCHKYKLVIEIDGDIHDNQKEYDIGRTAEMEKYGIKVIRFSNSEVENDIEKVINSIKNNLTQI
jgi:very-short-patch-repair endonuclease